MARLLTPLVRLSIAVSALATAVPSLDQRDDAAFVHPGIMMSKSQLNKMRSHVEAGSQPWADAYAVLEADDYASPTHEASPVATVVCGSYSNPDVGCTDERDDATAAYTNALAWYATGDQDRADKAIELMNAWSSTIQWHNDSNAPLQSGWAASVWTRAAEIIRHTGAGWDADDVAQFEDMLNEAYLPLIIDGSPRANGNWELVMSEGAINIGIFTNNRTTYKTAMDIFLARVPAYIYMTSDGDTPVAPANSGYAGSSLITYWQGQDTFQADGMVQETCRDLEHTGYGIASISHVAETSRIQGRDLYSTDVGKRLESALEFHTPFGLGEDVPDWLCGGSLDLSLVNVTEVGYSALAVRKGHSLPNTKKYTAQQRPGGANSLFIAWETLTHALGAL